MIYRKESADTFVSVLGRPTENINDGDILPPKYLKNTYGIKSDNVCIIIDNNIAFGHYIIIDEEGNETKY